MPRILIVDDEPAICAILRIRLSRAGYDVVVTNDVASAKAACTTQAFDAVLSDMIMPDGDGHELMRWMAINHPRTATALMTGFDLGCEHCPYAPRCKALMKPFKPDEALALLQKMLLGAPSERLNDIGTRREVNPN